MGPVGNPATADAANVTDATLATANKAVKEAIIGALMRIVAPTRVYVTFPLPLPHSGLPNPNSSDDARCSGQGRHPRPCAPTR